MKQLIDYLKFAALGGAVYLLGRYAIMRVGMDFTTAPDWLFRIVLIGFITWSIVELKRKKEGEIDLKQGLIAGLATTSFLALFMALATWFYCDVVNPTYAEGYKTSYREMHYNKMMRKYIADKWHKDTITQGAIDTVNHGLDLNIKNQTAKLFTTAGQVQMSIIYTFFWGIAISFTVAMLAHQTKDNE